jgi:hypothetical protein
MGAKAEIDVRASLGGILLLLLTFWLGRRHTRGKKKEDSSKASGPSRPELDGQDGRKEISANDRNTPMRQELAGADAKRKTIGSEKKGWSDSGYGTSSAGERAELDAKSTQKHQML